jgi:hypothetical protein
MGRATVGYYVVEGNLVTMTDRDGMPFHGRSGEKITHKLQTGDEPAIIAKRLTLQIHRASGWQIHRASRGDCMAGFNRPAQLSTARHCMMGVNEIIRTRSPRSNGYLPAR